jgi:hypothetical protein
MSAPLRHRSSWPTCGRAFVVLAFVSLSCAGHGGLKTTAPDPTKIAIDELWQDPRDLETRDLFYGPGGQSSAPDPASPYKVIAVDNSGFSAGYHVRDSRGVEWNVKVGLEAQSEIASSRVLWAVGYHQPSIYALTSWELIGAAPGHQGIARFRPKVTDKTVESDWSWYENPFVTTQPYRGLVVANLILNNWDWKSSNNKVYVAEGSDGPQRLYVVRDLGASLGRTSFPSFLKWTPFRMGKQGSRNDVDGFDEQGFITGVDGQHVKFDYHGLHTGLVNTLTVDDVVWTCRLMARLSDQQWNDAFRAAGYDAAHRQRYITKLKSKVRQGLDLAGT